jgi:hypothetical protein
MKSFVNLVPMHVWSWLWAVCSLCPCSMSINRISFESCIRRQKFFCCGRKICLCCIVCSYLVNYLNFEHSECCLTATNNWLSYSVMGSASALYSESPVFESWPGDWLVFHGFLLSFQAYARIATFQIIILRNKRLTNSLSKFYLLLILCECNCKEKYH